MRSRLDGLERKLERVAGIVDALQPRSVPWEPNVLRQWDGHKVRIDVAEATSCQDQHELFFKGVVKWPPSEHVEVLSFDLSLPEGLERPAKYAIDQVHWAEGGCLFTGVSCSHYDDRLSVTFGVERYAGTDIERWIDFRIWARWGD